ncbi:MAG: UDP-N-acetylmuramate--L-alanine ligase, partial [Oceanicaulis sp.]
FTRLCALFEEFCTCFNDADSVLVAPVYTAGEDPIEGADRDALVDGLGRHGHRDAAPTDRDRLVEDIKPRVKSGDLVVCLGAGDITAWAAELPERLEETV